MKENGSVEDVVKLLLKAAEMLGWKLIIPNSGDDTDYVLLCNPEKSDELVDKLESND